MNHRDRFTVPRSERPTVPPHRSHEELVLCAVAAGAVSIGAASLAVKTGLLPADAQRAAEALFRERFGYEHFASQMRGTL